MHHKTTQDAVNKAWNVYKNKGVFKHLDKKKYTI